LNIAFRLLILYCGIGIDLIFTKKFQCTENQFPTLRYANNDRHKGALSSVRAHSFRYKVKTRTTRSKSQTTQCRTRDETSVHCKSFFSKLNKPSVAMYSLESTCRVVLTMSMFLLWRFLPDIRSSNALKTSFQRCAMQITIAIKGALSSVRAHSFV
ncbi:hypothetical protein T09_11511, partial [Trichinella sp. T9]